ncbi:hypothetical protein QFZ72_001337 [Bacillus sp. V2I10]|nr:hypothetical protein [Bacillus sp. V2I10]
MTLFRDGLNSLMKAFVAGSEGKFVIPASVGFVYKIPLPIVPWQCKRIEVSIFYLKRN